MQFNINDLTLGQIKEIHSLGLLNKEKIVSIETHGICGMIGKKMIIRTYTAGVWFGTVDQKNGNEVIIKNARRLWHWKATQGISLSACALYGVDYKHSKVIEPVDYVWLEAIELISCTDAAITSIDGAPHVKAE